MQSLFNIRPALWMLALSLSNISSAQAQNPLNISAFSDLVVQEAQPSGVQASGLHTGGLHTGGPLDISTFRDLVIQEAQSRGTQASFVLNADDPYTFEIDYDGDQTTFYLTNTYNEYLANPDTGLEPSLETLLHLIDSFENNAFELPLNEDGLGVILRQEAIIEQILRDDPGLKGDMVTRASFGGLTQIMLSETGDPLSRAEAGRRSEDTLWARTLANINQSLPHVFKDTSIQDTTFYQMSGTPEQTSSLILSDKFWQSAAVDYPNGIIFILPKNDELYLIDQSAGGSLITANAIINAHRHNQTSYLSGSIFTYKNGNISVITP